ncbi:Hypothetical protein Cp1002B_0590 [Corynebacterium pseudotuberculosis]|nr:Hypothetical protein Cp4202_0555 [Corynebacterium pseudotuberculosis 42/02-A]AFH51490.1 Hypothetical protein Cp267_0585 [Corynebacterium pseudotuberculosis 267]AJC13297.1 hypothetical protein CpVD57_0574 [Corynebacterium pseudotuberculosis]AKJ55234.1 Hypothetical protein Cp12C_0596 [Corynebacterium pseudotuberculosis]ALM77175.1 Hypothetical protein Cp1002B_0590 [Corynebacterium pseudotuberculosis]
MIVIFGSLMSLLCTKITIPYKLG